MKITYLDLKTGRIIEHGNGKRKEGRVNAEYKETD